jgi:HAE1 family hydrophobic/amphiphilic exporter-1
VLGLGALWNLPLELAPNLQFPRLSIITYFPDSAPEMVEAVVTAPIESRVQQTPGLKSVNSVSENNQSRVELVFDNNIDMNWVQFQVNEILADYRTWLPPGIQRPQIQKYIPDEIEKNIFLSYRLLSDMPEEYLNTFVEEKIKRPVSAVPGVASVEVSGVAEPVVEILLDTKKMEALGLTLSEVQYAVLLKNTDAGELISREQRLPVVIVQNLKSIEELSVLPIKLTGSRIVTLQEIAQIRRTFPPLRNKKRINGYESVLITINREHAANTLQVAGMVFKRIEEIQNLLPDGNQLLLVDDASKEIRKSLHELATRGLFSLGFILLILLFGLKNIRAPIIISMSILLAMLGVFIGFFVLHITINLLTMAGLALGYGFMVDNAILVYDSLDRHRGQNISKAILEILPPLSAATLTTLAAIAPFVFLTGEMKTYYLPFAVVISLALMTSVISAVFYVPAAYQLTGPSVIRTSAEKSHSVYLFESILNILIGRRRWLIFLLIWSIGLPLWLLPKQIEKSEKDTSLPKYLKEIYNHSIGSAFYSALRNYSDPLLGSSLYLFFEKIDHGRFWSWRNPTYLIVSLHLPQGSAPGLSDENIRPFEEMALSEPGVARIEATIWPAGAYARIDFKPKDAQSGAPFRLKEELIARAARMSGLIVGVYGYGDGFSGGMLGSATATSHLDFKGYNYKELEQLALRFKETVEKNRRVRDVDINARYGYSIDDLYYLELTPQQRVLAENGQNISGALQQLRLYTSEYAGADRLMIGGHEEIVQIKVAGYNDFQTDQLMEQSFTEEDKLLKFAAFSTLEKKESANEISREDQQYIRKVSFDFLGPGRFAHEFLEKTLKEFPVPVGYKIEHSGYFTYEDEKSNLLFVVILGLIFVYMVTAALYESFRDPFLIFLTIPAGFIGIIWIFFASSAHFDNTAYIGSIFISGIVVNNSILLISRYKNYLSQGYELLSAVLQGTRDHLRPILLTSLTTIAGFLPMILFTGENNQSLWYNLALAGIGGMISSVMFILFFLPVLFYAIENRVGSIHTVTRAE